MTTDRLFIPLNAEHHDAFRRGEKDVELRGIDRGSQFNHNTVRPGRRVELRRGYQYDPMWGTIGQVWTSNQIAAIPRKIDHERILPGSTAEEFITHASALLSKYSRYIYFEIDLDREYVDE